MIGQHYKDERTGSTWYVCGVEGNVISMSGPGPCRGIQRFTLDEVKNYFTTLEPIRLQTRPTPIATLP